MLEDLKPIKKVRACKVRTLLEELSESDAKILSQAIGDVENWPARTLSDELKIRDILLSDLTITRHRNRLCSC